MCNLYFCIYRVSEQRRKRLHELEQKVTSLSKKVSEQERIIKMKESSEAKIINLKQEIMVGLFFDRYSMVHVIYISLYNL